MEATVTLSGLLLVALASVGWAGLDAFRKMLSERMAPLPVLVWLMGSQALMFLAWGMLSGDFHVEEGYFLPGTGALILNMISNWMFVYALSISPLSLTIPFLSFTPVFTLMVGIPLLGEMPSMQQVLGIVVVVGGALMLSAKGGKLFRAILEEKGSLMMIGVALLWSLVAPLDKLALGHGSTSVHALYQTAGISGGFALFLLMRGNFDQVIKGRKHIPLVLGAAVVATIALALQLESYQLMLVSLVEAIKRAIGLFLAVLIGYVQFKEPITWQKLLSVALMAIGTALVVF